MTNTTTRAAHLVTFNAEGRHGGTFTARTRADWKRAWREVRERAGLGGTVLTYAATVNALTGKLLSVSATPAVLRGA